MALIDTSLIVRSEDLASPHRTTCVDALRFLQGNGIGEICAQVLIEFWSVATRPTSANGLGFDPVKADSAIGKLLAALPLLPEPPDMAHRWRSLAATMGVSGRQVHDCRIAAFMLAHGVSHIVTLNDSDFARYPGIVAILPKDIERVLR